MLDKRVANGVRSLFAIHFNSPRNSGEDSKAKGSSFGRSGQTAQARRERSSRCWKRRKRDRISCIWICLRQRRIPRRGGGRRRILTISEASSLVVESGTSPREKCSKLQNCARLNSETPSTMRGWAMCNRRTSPPYVASRVREGTCPVVDSWIVHDMYIVEEVRTASREPLLAEEAASFQSI